MKKKRNKIIVTDWIHEERPNGGGFSWSPTLVNLLAKITNDRFQKAFKENPPLFGKTKFHKEKKQETIDG